MAASVTHLPSHRNAPLRHYAVLTVNGVDREGIATLVAGGYRVRVDGEPRTRLAALNDPHLVLLGQVDLADRQRAAEDAAGGLAALVCHHHGTGRL